MKRTNTGLALLVFVGLMWMAPLTAHTAPLSDSLAPPIIVDPVHGCSDMVAFMGVMRDSVVEIEVDDVPVAEVSGGLGWGMVEIPVPLWVGRRIKARQYYGGSQSYLSREYVYVQDVPPPDNAPPTYTLDTPVFARTLYECQQSISIEGLLNGATATLHRHVQTAQWDGASPYNHFHFLVPPLRQGHLYHAMQSFCPDSPFTSPWTIDAEVQPLPASLPQPIVDKDLAVEGHDYLVVKNLFPGAQFEVYAFDGVDSIPVGEGIANRETAHPKIDPPIDSNYRYYAVQWLCELKSPDDPDSGITPTAEVPAPSIVAPICEGETEATVCGVIPGTAVELFVNYSGPGDLPAAQSSGNGCVKMSLGGTAVLFAGDRLRARQIIANGSASEILASQDVTVTLNGLPEFEPNYWVEGGYSDTNNCYNYACDIIQDSPAEPGRASGISLPTDPAQWTDCDFLIDAVVADGMVPTTFEETCESCSHKLAMVMIPFTPGVRGLIPDYHFYRLNSDNETWSHMFKHEKPIRYDASGVLITDPESADRDYSGKGLVRDYSKFCGYFCVDKGQVNID